MTEKSRTRRKLHIFTQRGLKAEREGKDLPYRSFSEASFWSFMTYKDDQAGGDFWDQECQKPWHNGHLRCCHTKWEKKADMLVCPSGPCEASQMLNLVPLWHTTPDKTTNVMPETLFVPDAPCLSDQAIFMPILCSLIPALKTPGDHWIPVWALPLSGFTACNVLCFCFMRWERSSGSKVC